MNENTTIKEVKSKIETLTIVNDRGETVYLIPTENYINV